MIPRAGISFEHQRKAFQMINDLRLNADYRLDGRKYVTYLIERSLSVLLEGSEEQQEFLDRVVDRTSPFSSLARVVLEEQGFVIDE